VVRGLVLMGEFCEDDVVDAIHMGKITNPTVVEPVPFDPDLPFETVIGAHLYRGPVKAGQAAWLILDEVDGLNAGDHVGWRRRCMHYLPAGGNRAARAPPLHSDEG